MQLLTDTAELNATETRFYQELISILRWAVELGQIDIHFEVSRMSSYMASPRIGPVSYTHLTLPTTPYV